MALVIFIGSPSITRVTPSNGQLLQADPRGATHRSYLHMVSKPSDTFPKPNRGTWVYFVAVSPNKRHYLHCTTWRA